MQGCIYLCHNLMLRDDDITICCTLKYIYSAVEERNLNLYKNFASPQSKFPKVKIFHYKNCKLNGYHFTLCQNITKRERLITRLMHFWDVSHDSINTMTCTLMYYSIDDYVWNSTHAKNHNTYRYTVYFMFMYMLQHCIHLCYSHNAANSTFYTSP